MEKDGWKGLFRPENKNMRSNVMLALFVGILLLAAGKGFSSESEISSIKGSSNFGSSKTDSSKEAKSSSILKSSIKLFSVSLGISKLSS